MWNAFFLSNPQHGKEFSTHQMSNALDTNTQRALFHRQVKAMPAYEPSGPPGQSLSRFQEHEANRSISTPLWNGIFAHCRVTSSIKFDSTPFIGLRDSEMKVSGPRPQCNVPGQAWTQTARYRVKCFKEEAFVHPNYPIGCTVTPLPLSCLVTFFLSLSKKLPWVYIVMFNFKSSLLWTVYVSLL